MVKAHFVKDSGLATKPVWTFGYEKNILPIMEIEPWTFQNVA
jgi:hypothetical protein